MINIGSSTGYKLGILIVLATLTIGSAAAISWENPSSNDVNVKGTSLTLNVTGASQDVSFWIKKSSENSYSDNKTGSPDSNNYASVTYSKSSGTYDFKANNSNDNIERTSITLDGVSPSLDSKSPTGYISDNSPTIEASVSDDHSGIDYTYLNVTDSSNNDVDSTQGTSISLSNLDDEEHTVDYYIKDNAGNWRNSSWTFTVDTSYDGDSSPSLTVEDESNGVVLFNGDKDLTVDFGDADSTSDTTVTCVVGGENVDSFTVNTGDGNQEYTCNIEHDDNEDYFDSEAEVYVEMEDEAGNTDQSSSETVSFDVNPPTVSSLEIPINADLYNSNFDVEFSAFDSASDVEEVEYYFESGTSVGEGTSFDSVDQDSYEINTSELSAGDHTLYVRARDEADRWSSAETVNFSFDPDAIPEISLDVPQNVSVTAGNNGSFDVPIENTGELYISSLQLTGSAEGVFTDTQNILDVEPEGSITATLRIDTESNNIGEHTIEVSTDKPSMTKEIDLIVEANAEQQEEIDSNLSEYQSKLQKMEANVTTLMQKVSEDNKQKLDSNFSSFKQKVEDAQTAVDNSNYYEAEAVLEGIDQDYSAAASTYETVNKEYKNNQFWMLVFLSLGGIIVLGGGIIGALSYTDEVDFDIRDYLEDLQELEFDASGIENIPDKIKRLMEGKDTSDAEDFEWEGFNNN